MFYTAQRAARSLTAIKHAPDAESPRPIPV